MHITMMLLIEERPFSFRDRFTIRDEAGQDRYSVEGELFSWGKQLHIRNMTGDEVAYIEQKVFSFKPRYRVFVGDDFIGEIVREFTFFSPRYTVEGADWDVEGDFFAHDYTVLRGGTSIASISKEWFTFGDCYALRIADPADEICALALVLAIDCAMEQQN